MYERTAATFFIIPPQFLRTYIIEGGLQLSKVRDVSGGADILKISQHCHKEYLNLWWTFLKFSAQFILNNYGPHWNKWYR